MKPIKLIISAFGPYADKMPAIEFGDFEEKGYFLISGDTGAGKTMIFDAMCFALYGETSGHDRDKGRLKSEYADSGTDSYVDFYFSHGGKEYHILRKPAYDRINNRGNITNEPEKVIFYYPDGSTVEGKRRVDGTKDEPGIVKELLHIDYNQFSQIAMIAQGEFRSLLNAKTDKRTEILRTIFNTGSYKNIEYRLKDRKSKSEEEKYNLSERMKQHFDDVTADENDEIASELAGMKEKTDGFKTIWNLEEIIELTKRVIEADKVKTDPLNNTLKEAENELEKYRIKFASAKENNDKIRNLNDLIKEKESLEAKKQSIDDLFLLLDRQKASLKVYPEYKNWESQKNKLEDIKIQIKERKEALEKAIEEEKLATDMNKEAEKRRDEAEGLRKKAEKIDEDKNKYELREKYTNRLENLDRELSDTDKKTETVKNEKELLNKRTEQLKETIEALKDSPVKYSETNAQKEKLETLSDSIDRLANDRVRERNNKKTDLLNKQTLYEKSRREYDEVMEEYNTAEKQSEYSRAGILAAKLKEGEKCPVCGSTHHPDPAKLTDTDITDEDLKKLKEKKEALEKKKTDHMTDAKSANEAYIQYEESLSNEITECIKDCNKKTGSNIGFEGDIEYLIAKLAEVRSITEKMIADNEALLSKYSDDSAMLERSQEKLKYCEGAGMDELNKREEELTKNRQNLDKERISIVTELKNLEGLGYADWKTAESERSEAYITCNKIIDMINETEKRKQEAGKIVTAIRSAAIEQENNKSQQEKEEAVLKEAFENELKARNFQSADEMKMYYVSEEDIKDEEEKIGKYKELVLANRTKLEQAEKEADGKTYIDIEELKAECDERETNVKKIRADINKIENRIIINQQKLEAIISNVERYKKVSHENNIYTRLYNLVSGQKTGNLKITLEQYIQAAGFEGIIKAANRRLGPMSDGQFELFRKEDASGKQSNTFLDLEVLDNYTGHRRPVCNLSGGESFKASLSLALGLSDTVSSNMGGIQMDALFIDEGFGTLDRRSIESAMNIIINLSGKNKLVGIISHREELKETVTQQIIVKKTREGSRFEVDRGL